MNLSILLLFFLFVFVAVVKLNILLYHFTGELETIKWKTHLDDAFC